VSLSLRLILNMAKKLDEQLIFFAMAGPPHSNCGWCQTGTKLTAGRGIPCRRYAQ
jgi:hypothetical protein